jgi:hypothetical protein
MTALAGRRWLSGIGLDETELLEKFMKELVSVSWRSRSGRSVGRSVDRNIWFTLHYWKVLSIKTAT